MTDPVVKAMEAGAGLPVLKPLDRLLERRSLDGEAPEEAESVEQLLDVVDGWLDGTEDRVRERVEDAYEGPLKDRIPRRLGRRWGPAREDVRALRGRLSEGSVPWDAVIDLLEDLQALRREAAHLQRAAGHLAELARLVEDVPDDGEGHEALDDLAEREARAAARDDPEAWAREAERLEEAALKAVRVYQDPPATPTSGEDPAPDPVAAEDEEETETPQAEETETDEEAPNQEDPQPAAPEPEPEPASPARAGTNGHPAGTTGHGAQLTSPERSNGHHEPVQPPEEREPVGGHADLTPDEDARGPRPADEPRAPRTASRTGHEHPAGPDVLAEWEDADLDGLRHGPFWAPIAQGEVVPREGSAQAALERAREVEVDLVEIELPRALAVAAGGDPATVRRRIAERAEQVTRREPDRPAREAFLDYVVGKLPRRYRETAWGLTLVASIAHALCTDDAWRASGPGYGDTLRRMVEAELKRTPAVDVPSLAASLVGSSAEARELVEEAACEIAREDDDVTLHEDGVLVRALAAREDPDALYELKQRLAKRLGAERADTIVTTLITTDRTPENGEIP